MANEENELSHDEKIARIKEIIDHIEWVRRRELAWRGDRFLLGGIEAELLFSGSADGAVEWLTRHIATEEPKRRMKRCDCPACLEYWKKNRR